MLICLGIVYGCFHTTTADLSDCNKTNCLCPQSLKYLLAPFCKKSLLTLVLENGGWKDTGSLHYLVGDYSVHRV